MDHFNYIDGELHVDGIRARDIVAKYGSPVYVYSARTLVHHYLALKEAFSAISPMICFSVKSCSNLSILKLLSSQGSAFDVVSGGEIYRAVKAGVAAEKIVFAGVGKSTDELRGAVEAGVFLFNVESEAELERLDAVATAAGKRVKAAIRVNPDVADAGTNAKTSTGGRQTKFGVPIMRADALYAPRSCHSVDVVGIHIHLGSPIPDTDTYLRAIDKVEQMVDRLESAGCTIEFINIGGGFPARYSGKQCNSLADIGKAIGDRLQGLKRRGKHFIVEPGRAISANAGILLTTVEYMKNGWDRRIAIVDAGMNTLVRPTLYGASHVIWPTESPGFSGHWSELGEAYEASGLDAIDVVGPICETGDYFALGRPMPAIESASVLAIFSCGAYGMSMASQYNSRVRPAEVLVDGRTARLVRAREREEDLIAHELCGLEGTEECVAVYAGTGESGYRRYNPGPHRDRLESMGGRPAMIADGKDYLQ